MVCRELVSHCRRQAKPYHHECSVKRICSRHIFCSKITSYLFPAAAGSPLIVLLFSAAPVDIRWAVNSSKVEAILQCHFSAQATGDALEMVLLGQENPAGRLPYTWPVSMDQVKIENLRPVASIYDATILISLHLTFANVSYQSSVHRTSWYGAISVSFLQTLLSFPGAADEQLHNGWSHIQVFHLHPTLPVRLRIVLHHLRVW